MLIQCPKCRAVYNLPDMIVPNQGMRMRCAKCHEIWTAYKADALPDADQISQQAEAKRMFASRIPAETQNLFDQAEPKVVEKIQVVKVTKYKHTINWTLLLIALLSLVGIVYCMRYEIVRKLPDTEKFYRSIGVQSVPYGRNLDFRNVSVQEFVGDDNISKLELRGSIANTGAYQADIPPLKIEVRDLSGKSLSDFFYYLPLQRLQAGYRLLFNVVLTNPTAFGKSVYVRFADHEISDKGE